MPGRQHGPITFREQHDMKTRRQVAVFLAAMTAPSLLAQAQAAGCGLAGGDTVCIPAPDHAGGGLDRAPRRDDDSRRGYGAGDLWQASGRVWRAVSVAPGDARWENVAVRLPGDAFGSHTVFAGGPMRLVSGYAGPALDIETVSAGQMVITTLAIGGDGRLDTVALQRALSARDPGTFANVVRVYDQSGHGNHITATPGHHVVHIGAVRVGGIDTLSWGEENGAGGFVLPEGLKVAADGFFFGTTGTYASSNSGNAAVPMPVLLGQAGSGREFKAFIGSYTLDGFVHVADTRSPDLRTDLVITSSPAATGVAAGPGGYTLQAGNAHVTLPGMLPGGTLSGGYIGYNADGGPWFVQGRNTGQWTGIVIADHAPTTAQTQDFAASAAAAGDYMPQLRDVFVAIGDSRTEGFRVHDGRNWPYLMQRFARYQSYDFAVSGATTRQMLDMLPAAETVARGAARKVAVVFGGYNDHLPAYHIPAADTVGNLKQIVSRLKAAGYTVAIIDEAQTGGSPRAAVHDAIAKGTIGADITIDPFAAGQPLANVLDHETWDPDTTHPNQAGHEVMAKYVWDRIGSLFSK
ncbi:SGNH/GDSL hydrolase family protein [Komagataeibacter europaeus]|uniref:SGNH/GDSL hydrolase family protein n=1 Tax=Komagataeibacter europaeus TaxID=33995 RepID=UPI000B3E70CD|nr:SGNH/GDSL hydrolase family protein [Komagataeibacter europaeus]